MLKRNTAFKTAIKSAQKQQQDYIIYIEELLFLSILV